MEPAGQVGSGDVAAALYRVSPRALRVFSAVSAIQDFPSAEIFKPGNAEVAENTRRVRGDVRRALNPESR